jgi:DNA-directed RNA polymerase subunit M/transcription elongation factor TFIIS
MATASGSSASHGVPKRLRPDLPLITCGKCGQKTVREYKVKKKGPNQGRIFYTCLDCEVSNFFVMFCYDL